ncbi:MAG: protein-disulfide reductase DsbD domain-containing protein [Betaproteobacteria bacterium]
MRAGAGRQVAGTKVAGAHVDLTAYPSDSAIAPGNRITLAFNVVPHPGVHVYAPGADKQGYRPIAVRIDPSPLVQVLAPVYPASEIYVFQPLNERVPVYQKPFTLLQDIVLQGTPQAQQALRGQTSITIKGTVDYQACDDKVCFNPESVPLSWTFTLRSIVFERPTPKHWRVRHPWTLANGRSREPTIRGPVVSGGVPIVTRMVTLARWSGLDS